MKTANFNILDDSATVCDIIKTSETRPCSGLLRAFYQMVGADTGDVRMVLRML